MPSATGRTGIFGKGIDCHLHFSPGDRVHMRYARMNGLDYSLKGLLDSMRSSGIEKGLLIAPPKQNGNEEAKRCAESNPHRLIPIATYTPSAGGLDQLRAIEQPIAIKIPLGYEPYTPSDRVYEPAYELAMTLKIPVIFHTGDTAVSNAKLKYAHPLLIDDVACERPQMQIVLAHLGNPWIMDAAEVVYKNENVYADMSGLVVAGGRYFKTFIRRVADRLTEAVQYIGHGERIVFGSDWPFCRIDTTVRLLGMLRIEDHDRERIFWHNAKRLFRLD